MRNRILFDANFLIAVHDSTDDHHFEAQEFLTVDQNIWLVPQVILAEVAHHLDTKVGLDALLAFWDTISQPDIELESINRDDLLRAKAIRLKYDTARFDFADCCIMALSERLNITQICTFDYRHFHAFRPTHCDYLELLP